MRRHFSYILLLILWLAGQISFGQNQYKFTQLNLSDGLAHNNVFELYQDRNNYVWIGAGNKLQRYDGARFITLEHEQGNPQSLAFGDIRCILEDSQGALWAGTDGGGLSRFKDGKVQTFKNDGKPGSITSNNIEHLIEMPDSSIFIATWGGGINIYKNGKFSSLRHSPIDLNTISNDNVVDILFDPETEILWVASWETGLCNIQNGKVTRFEFGPEGFNAKRARCLEKTADGSIWIGSWGNGLFQYKDGHFKQYCQETGDLIHNNILTLSSSGNQLWIGSWGGGLTLFENGQFTNFRNKINQINTISSDFIESSIFDQNGNLWIGTFGGGITIVEKKQFTSFDDLVSEKDITSKLTNSIIQDHKGQIWIAGIQGMMISSGGQFSAVQNYYPDFPNITNINALFCAKNGDIWIGGSTGVGLYQFDGKRVIDRSIWGKTNFKNYFIQSIFQASDSSIWISADVDAGVNQIKDNKLIRYFSDPENPNSLSSNDTYATTETSDGTIWIASSRYGLNSLKNGKITRFQVNDLDTSTISNNNVYCLLNTSQGDLWIGTEYGLNLYDPDTDRFKKFYKKDGLQDNTVLSLIEDASGNIWIGTLNGVSRLDPFTHFIQNFDQRNTIEGPPFLRNALFQDRITKQIYVGGINGMIVFHPDSIKQNVLKQNLQITNIQINNESLLFDDFKIKKIQKSEENKIIFKRFEGNLSFDFSDMDYGKIENPHHLYRIFPLEENWNNAGSGLTANYSNIPPGDYHFEVKASFDGINWSAPARLSFTHLPLWYERIWFKILLAIVLIGLVPIIVIARFSYLDRQKKKLETLISEKTEEISRKNAQILQKSEDLEKSNQALKKAMFELHEMDDQRIIFQENERQAISRELHDSISTMLFGIRMMFKKGQKKNENDDEIITVPAKADKMLGQVIRDSQIILNNLSTSFIKHTSFFDSLNDLVNRSQEISHARISLIWKGDEHIEDLKLGSNLFRIIQEALSNCLKHALAKNINIHLINAETISCQIIDDGIGFDLEKVDQMSSGLGKMHHRADDMDAILKISSHPKLGTTVSVSISPA